VIVGFNGEPISSSAELPLAVGDVRPGETATVRVWRQGKPQDLKIVIGESPQEQVAQADPAATDQPRLGVAVRPLTPGEGAETGTSAGAGLVVEQSSGPAAAAGIAPGDVILSVNGTPVKSAEELRAAIQKAGKHAALLVQRQSPDGGRMQVFVPVELG
jgi:serine protease Do